MKADVSARIVEALAEGLARRLIELKAAAERLQRFAFEPGEEGPELLDAPEAEDAALRDLVLRALARATDPVNFKLLECLSSGDATVGGLAEELNLPRAATAERINDLLQVGLVGRSHRGDEAGLTPAGRAVVDLVSRVVDRGRGTQ